MPVEDFFFGGLFFCLFSSKQSPDVQRVVRTIVLRLEDKVMTNDERSKIAEMRKQGYGYTRIAEALSISINTVKTYCRRNSLSKGGTQEVCKYCGTAIASKDRRNPRQFCSDKCRAAWWYANHSDKAKTVYHLTCANCGQPFVSSGSKARKYCSHQCYIAARFGGDRHE